MTIDTTALTESMQTILDSVFDFLPVAAIVVGVPAGLGLAFALGSKLIGYFKSGLGGK